MAESYQEKLKRVRPPRVKISYEVETEGAVVQKELPFVVGVIGDFSGNPAEPLKPLGERKFVEINRDNFDSVMAKMTPGVNLRVANTLKNDGTELGVELSFRSMADFEPANVARQVEPLRRLLEMREKLRDLQAKVDVSGNLEQVLEKTLETTEGRDKLKELMKDQGEGKDGK